MILALCFYRLPNVFNEGLGKNVSCRYSNYLWEWLYTGCGRQQKIIIRFFFVFCGKLPFHFPIASCAQSGSTWYEGGARGLHVVPLGSRTAIPACLWAEQQACGPPPGLPVPSRLNPHPVVCKPVGTFRRHNGRGRNGSGFECLPGASCT